MKRSAYRSAVAVALSVFMLVLPATTASAATNRSDACNKYFCGSATFTKWKKKKVRVGWSVADKKKGDGLAFARVRYYRSNCTYKLSKKLKAPGNGSGTYAALSETHKQANFVGARVLLKSKKKGPLLGNWVDNPKNPKNVVCKKK